MRVTCCRALLARMRATVRQEVGDRAARHQVAVLDEALLAAGKLGYQQRAELGHTVGICRVVHGVVLLARIGVQIEVLLAARLDAAGQLLVRYAAYQEAGLRTPEVLEFQRRVRGSLPGQRADLERQLARLRSPETGSGEADQETGERLPEPEAGACGTGIRSCCQ